jgi:hypothetical protein
MSKAVLLLTLIALVSCTRWESVSSVPPAPLPDTHQLLEEDREAPSFHKIHEHYFEPHWM